MKKESMPAMPSAFSTKVAWIALLLMAIAGCTAEESDVPANAVQLYQSWSLQPGSTIGDHPVIGSIGDISIELKGDRVYAPFNGTVHPHQADCVLFKSPEVPAYLFRLCGLQHSRFGERRAGDTIGSSTVLQFAALRKQPNGTWALVEPAIHVLEKTVGQP